MERANKKIPNNQNIKVYNDHKITHFSFLMFQLSEEYFFGVKEITIYLLILLAADYTNYHKKLLPLIKILL